MKNLPDPGTVISYNRIDDFTGDIVKTLGTVLGEARSYIDETTHYDNLSGIPFGIAVIVRRHTLPGQDVNDLVFDDFTIIEGESK